MPRLARIAPELPVASLPAALQYYAGKLGFEVAMEWPDGEYAIVERDDVAIHLFQRAANEAPVGIHVFTDGLDELHDELLSRGAAITQSVQRKPWGNRDFRVKDSSGNEIKFTELPV